MTKKNDAAAQPQASVTARPQVQIAPGAREAHKLYEREIATYLRELPRLLAEGYIWKHALVKGDEILSVWDTQSDALQAGTERFGLDPIFVKTIDPRDPERFALVMAQMDSSCPS
jgi:hypothetical protein